MRLSVAGPAPAFPTALFFSFLTSVVSIEVQSGEPYLQVMAKSTVFEAGSKRAIFCKGVYLNGVPIEWFYPSGHKVPQRDNENKRLFVDHISTNKSGESHMALIIQEAEVTDSGIWTCRAGQLSDSIDILVGERVVLNGTIEEVSGSEGTDVMLQCSTEGFPEPVVQWYKDDEPIEDDDKYDMNKEVIFENNINNITFELVVKNLTREDFGQYLCKVTQDALSHYADKAIDLSVLHKPVIILHEKIYSETERVEEVYAVHNETKNITCQGMAYPPPIFSWFRESSSETGPSLSIPITDENMVFNSEAANYSVLMLPMYDTDFGLYKCTINNSMGLVTVLYDVQPGSKPNPPDFVNLYSANVTEFTFNVTCTDCDVKGVNETSNTSLPVTGYEFEMTQVGKNYSEIEWDSSEQFQVKIHDDNETLFTVGPLQPGTTYHVRVRSFNEASSSEWVDVTPDPVTLVATTSTGTSTVSSLLVTLLTMAVYRH